jgi:multisubunit Na+/H+ antiporter MnhB subunit
MGYAAGAIVALLLAYGVSKKSAKAQTGVLSRYSMRLLAIALLLVACVASYASYQSTVFQYYVDTTKAPV